MTHKNFLVADAAHFVTETSGRYVGTDTVRRAAKRIGAYDVDESGYGIIPRPVVEDMATTYKATGYLVRRLVSHRRAGDASAPPNPRQPSA
jgi:hypothetical protein